MQTTRDAVIEMVNAIKPHLACDCGDDRVFVESGFVCPRGHGKIVTVSYMGRVIDGRCWDKMREAASAPVVERRSLKTYSVQGKRVFLVSKDNPKAFMAWTVPNAEGCNEVRFWSYEPKVKRKTAPRPTTA